MKQRHLNRIPNWVVSERYPLVQISDIEHHWLLDSSSLTRRIILWCNDSELGSFKVRVVSQYLGKAANDEIQRLGLRQRSYALIREVVLYCGEKPVIFARTVIPKRTLTGKQRRLAFLGDRPLGAYLFSQPNLAREAMEIAQIRPEHTIHQMVENALGEHTGNLWGRRSVFRLKKKPLLVAEIFLPALFK